MLQTDVENEKKKYDEQRKNVKRMFRRQKLKFMKEEIKKGL